VYTSRISTRINSTRTQAIFQAIFDSILNKLAKISARMFQREPKLSSKLNYPQSTGFIQKLGLQCDQELA